MDALVERIVHDYVELTALAMLDLAHEDHYTLEDDVTAGNRATALAGIRRWLSRHEAPFPERVDELANRILTRFLELMRQ